MFQLRTNFDHPTQILSLLIFQLLFSYNKSHHHNNANSGEPRRQTRATRNQPTTHQSKDEGIHMTAQNNRKRYTEPQEIQEQQKPQAEQVSMFTPTLDTILNRRHGQTGDQYLIKFKNKSHLHTQWMNQNDLIAMTKSAKSKINRFVKLYEKKRIEMELAGELPQDETVLFDPALIQVQRILHTSQIFSIVHQKKSNEIKGKWSQSLTLVCRKLLNYIRDHISYGVYFMEPVNTEIYPNYKKIVPQPMDLGTILNRLYLDVYSKPQDFWKDIGLIWRNCRKFNEDPDSDIRIICETLKQASVWLYDQWHALSLQRFNVMKQEFYKQHPQLLKTNEPQMQEEEVNNISDQKNQQIDKDLAARSQIPSVLEKNNEISSIQDEDKKVDQSREKNMDVEQDLNRIDKQQKQKSVNNQKQLQNIKQNQSQKKSGEDVMDDEEQNDKQQNQNEGQFENAPSSQNGDQQIDEYLVNNIFLQQKKVPIPTTVIQLQRYDPGELDYTWINPENEQQQKSLNVYKYLDQQDAKQLNLNSEINQLFLIKWKGVSYLGSTWQKEKDINALNKINEFKMFNKALDKESRTNMLLHSDYHQHLADLIINPKKKYKYSNAQIDQMNNVLYCYDIGCKKALPKYNDTNKPRLKNGRELRSYQVESLNWMIQAWYHRKNVILADEMGLGKTVQSISVINHLFTMEGRKGPFLVLAPLTTLEHWKRTVDDWTNFNSTIYYDQQSHAGRSSLRSYQWFYTEISTKGTVLVSKNLYKVNVIISSYQVFLADFEIFRSVPIQYIIVDEAHRLKNQNAKILTCLKQLPCKRILLLTGTPIQNNTDELWTLLNYLQPSAFPRQADFRRDFGNLKTGQQVQRLNLVLKPYMLRRMKQDVQQSIPPLHETIVDIEMTTLQKTIYRALYEKNKGMLMKGIVGSNVTTSLNNLEMQLRKCCNHPFLIKQMEAQLLKDVLTQDQRITKLLESSGKMTLVDKLFAKFRKEKKKILVFSQFTYMLVLLEDLLKFRGIKYEKIDGQTKAKERQVAIDRYNNPSRNRDVFLLSTKAGGIGINLTSANIVVIFDSDWNPQNDVQATARAHRIGQQSQVKVFRLITDKTYQSQMFQRAVLKLGLDQAIFRGGDFKGSIKDNMEIENKTDNKTNKQETQILLKMGILGLIKDAPETQNNNFYENDIDQILAKNSRQAEYSLIKGSYSFDKKKFVSNTCDKQLQLNDPNFWQKVLKNIETQSQKLSKKMQNSQNYQTASQQQSIMKQLQECVTQLLNSKVSTLGYSEDDEKTLTQILTLIMSQKAFSKPYRDLAHQWCSDLGKPSRRFKKATLDNIDHSKLKKKSPSVNPDEKVFVDSQKQSDDFNQVQAKGFTTKQVLDDEKKEQYIKKLCYLCQRPKCILFCQGYCKRAFHTECKKRVDNGQINIDGPPLNIDPQETKWTDEKLKQELNHKVVCSDCSDNTVLCFICKKKGKYYGAEYIKKKNPKAEKNSSSIIKLTKKTNQQGDQQDVLVDEEPQAPLSNALSKSKNEVTKCSTANCARFFHPGCIETFEGKSLFKALDEKSLHFRCSLHYCFKCGVSGDTMSIAQCIRCPKAYHLRCMDKEKTVKMTKKLIICEKHKRRQPKKLPLKVAMKQEKKQKKQAEKDQLLDSGFDDIVDREYRRGTRTTLRGRVLDVVTVVQPLTSRKIPPTTYQQMQIPKPTQFDYTKYKNDWCRYCGTRFSSNFTQGPWGPKTLCTVHYISWKTKKTLNLDSHIQRPTSPINPSDDQQLKYINSIRAKGNVLDYKQLIDSGLIQ